MGTASPGEDKGEGGYSNYVSLCQLMSVSDGHKSQLTDVGVLGTVCPVGCN